MEPERHCRGGDVPSGLRERAFDGVARERRLGSIGRERPPHRRGRRGRRSFADLVRPTGGRGEVRRPNLTVPLRVRRRRRLDDPLLQLAGVARPRAQEDGLDDRRMTRQLSRRPRGDRLHQPGDVLVSLAQRRDHHGGESEAVIEVIAKPSAGHLLGEIAVRGRAQTHIDRDRLRGAEGEDLPLLEHAKEFRLDREIEVGDFVEEERPAVCRLEVPLGVGLRAGVRPLSRAEEEALGQRVRNRGAVDVNERTLAPPRSEVKVTRGELLARPRLPANMHAAPLGRGVGERAPDRAKGRPDDDVIHALDGPPEEEPHVSTQEEHRIADAQDPLGGRTLAAHPLSVEEGPVAAVEIPDAKAPPLERDLRVAAREARVAERQPENAVAAEEQRLASHGCGGKMRLNAGKDEDDPGDRLGSGGRLGLPRLRISLVGHSATILVDGELMGDEGSAGRSLETGSLSDDSSSSGRVAVAGQDFPIVSRANYEIGEEFARGGSGRLMRARDRRLDRLVAIKEPRELSSRVQSRFRREALLTARLQHPSIVPVHEIGRWPSGEPFYAMKLISGRSLRDVVADTTSLAQRVALVPNVLAVADAIAYAHAERVIHRDLKPSNVMVGAFGETQVIDWGLAKALREPDDADDELSADRTLHALETGIVGTPSSMAPEQAAGKKLDERTDVYGVGAILYHVLAGGPPYVGDDAAKVLATLTREPPPPIAERAPGAPRELVAIVGRAMARDPADRYPSAKELAADLRRFLAGQLVAAHAYSWWQLLLRFIRRNRLVLGIATLSLTALGVFGDYSVRRILVEQENAQTQRSRLLLSQAKLWMDRDPTVGIAWLKEYAKTRDPDKTSISTLAADARARGVSSQRVRDRLKATLAPDGVTLAAQAGDSLVVWRTDDTRARVLGAVKTPVGALEFSSDSRTLFVGEAGVVNAYGLGGGPPRELLRGDENIRQLTVAGSLLVATGLHGTMWLLDPSTPSAPPRALRGNPDAIWVQHVSSDGKVLLSSSRYRVLPVHLRVWHLPGGESESIPGVPVWPALSSDGSMVAWGDDDGVVHVYDIAKRTTRELRGHHGGIRQLAFSTDGASLASTSEDHAVRVWDLASGRSLVLEGHTDWTQHVEFARDGRHLASTSMDQTIRVWDLTNGDCQILRGYVNPIDVIEFTPDSRTLVSVDSQGEVRVWPIEHPSDRALVHGEQIAALRFLPDGRLLGGDDQGIDISGHRHRRRHARLRPPVRQRRCRLPGRANGRPGLRRRATSNTRPGERKLEELAGARRSDQRRRDHARRRVGGFGRR